MGTWSRSLIVIGTLVSLAAAVLAACTPARPATPSASPPKPAETSLPAELPTHGEPLLISLPPGATQLQYGAEVYRLVCQDCHGDRGQGLTQEWRNTWAPEDRNCWQSKCHAANHPPEGFILPVAPAIVGPHLLQRFKTAADLQEYIRVYMPWYHPGRLTEQDSWEVTAFLLKMNSIDPGDNLSAATAAQIRLH